MRKPEMIAYATRRNGRWIAWVEKNGATQMMKIITVESFAEAMAAIQWWLE